MTSRREPRRTGTARGGRDQCPSSWGTGWEAGRLPSPGAGSAAPQAYPRQPVRSAVRPPTGSPISGGMEGERQTDSCKLHSGSPKGVQRISEGHRNFLPEQGLSNLLVSGNVHLC
ncbi:unnamed protein product [Ixodes pacificus]